MNKIYSSEKITRLVIEKFSKILIKDDKIKNLIEKGKLIESDNKANEKYFWFGSALFGISGILLLFLSSIIMVLITVFVVDLKYGNFFLYFPGFILLTIGLFFDFKERSCKKKKETISFTKTNLCVSIFIGLLVAFMASAAQ